MNWLRRYFWRHRWWTVPMTHERERICRVCGEHQFKFLVPGRRPKWETVRAGDHAKHHVGGRS